MNTSRLEAFTDGVIAILITIMVLELRPPPGGDWAALRSIAPILLTYLLSFVVLGIYWNNHHHMLQVTDHVNGKILWANLHLLFWLSLVPFTTRWMYENHFEAVPTAVYGVDLLLAAVAYTVLQRTILASQGERSRLAAALGNDFKGWLSLACYVVAIPLAFVERWLAVGLYVFVVLTWLVPDRRIESQLGGEGG